MSNCVSCRRTLPAGARFCLFCGAEQPVDLLFNINPDSAQLEQDIAELYFPALKQRIADMFGLVDPQPFLERVYASGFRDLVQRRSQQAAEQINNRHFNNTQLNAFLEDLLEDLLDFFLIRHCADLFSSSEAGLSELKKNNFSFPQAILAWQQYTPNREELYQMVLDYLDIENEELPLYADLLRMSKEQMRNAGKFFLSPEREERIFVIGDLSVLGSCREGFALTETALYWKAPLQTARRVLYAELDSVKREDDWLLINGHFFNAGLGLNLKIFLLLKKMKRVGRGA